MVGTLCCIVLKLLLCLYRQSRKAIIRRRQAARSTINLIKPYPFFCLPPAINKAHMNIENTQSQMRKGILEFCILSIIRRGESYLVRVAAEAVGLELAEAIAIPPRKTVRGRLDVVARAVAPAALRAVRGRGDVQPTLGHAHVVELEV